MKNSQPIRELLGMNQHDMAMLLGVSRSHYAIFEKENAVCTLTLRKF